jgi:hypothetical protein
MKHEKKYKLLQDVLVNEDFVTYIVSTMEYSNSKFYLVAGIGNPVHEKDITPINKK